MKIAVTGASGYIGSHVVKKICDLGHEVIAISRHSGNIDNRALIINMDILDLDGANMYEKLQRPDVCLHLAWQDGFDHYADSHMENLTAHFRFLKNIIDNGCKSITVMGTVHEVGYHEGKVTQDTPCRPLSYYGVAKNSLRQLIEIYAKGTHVSLKWLRAYYIYGNDELNHSIFTKIIEAVREGKKEFPFTRGTNQFDFIHIEELATQIALATAQNDVLGIINVCSGFPVAIKDVVEEFIKTKQFDIKLDYGKFPMRKYDSPVVYGDNQKISQIIKKIGESYENTADNDNNTNI